MERERKTVSGKINIKKIIEGSIILKEHKKTMSKEIDEKQAILDKAKKENKVLNYFKNDWLLKNYFKNS